MKTFEIHTNSNEANVWSNQLGRWVGSFHSSTFKADAIRAIKKIDKNAKFVFIETK